jgi:hypothetical protein
MTDSSAIKSHFDEQMPYFTFHPESQQPVIRHLPHNSPVEDMWRIDEPCFWHY